jgi:hypothetical protein
MDRRQLWTICIGLALFTNGCAFHSTAKNWSGLVGVDGKPAYYKKTTKVVFNAFVIIPFLGNASIDGMVRDMTADIVKEKGNNVRIVQGASENYWYGFPPFTWILTPVTTTVSAEYTPDRKAYSSDQKKIRDNMENGNELNPLEW